MYYGDFTPGKTIYLAFNTHQSDGTPITLAGSPAVRVYKGADTTEDDSGITLTVDFDSRTGSHVVAIDTSADGTFYAAGSEFRVVITAGTVDSISVVGTVVGTFSLSNRSALRPTTADRTLDVTSAGGAGIDWANVENPTANVILSGTTVGAAEQVNSKTGYALSATGLDAIPTTAPTGVASNFREMLVQVWRRFFKRSTRSQTQIKTYADNNTTVLTTQAYTSGSTDDVGAAT